MKVRAWSVLAVLVAAGVAGVGYKQAHEAEQARLREEVRQELSKLSFPGYGPQKVVYHVSMSGGWNDRNYREFLGSLSNHVVSVGEAQIDMRVVLQGDGLNLLVDARSDERLRSAIDRLRDGGVRFVVCRNSMVSRAIPTDRMYGVKNEDIVQAAVAEISALQAQGYTYMRF